MISPQHIFFSSVSIFQPADPQLKLTFPHCQLLAALLMMAFLLIVSARSCYVQKVCKATAEQTAMRLNAHQDKHFHRLTGLFPPLGFRTEAFDLGKNKL